MPDDLDVLLARTWAPSLHRMRYEPVPGAVAPSHLSPHGRRPPPRTAVEVRDGERGAATADVTEVLRAAVEVLDGRRPHRHLRELFTPAAARYWRATAAVRDRSGTVRLHRVHVCRPRTEVVEAAAVLVDGTRVRALAARFERRRGGWRCVLVRLL